MQYRQSTIRSPRSLRALLVALAIFACSGGILFAQNDPSPIAPRDSQAFPIWVRAEAVMWWINDYNAPALLVSNPIGTPDDDIGTLTDPTTDVLYGGKMGGGFRAGPRITAGMWLDECRCYGAQVEFFGLGRDSSNFSSSPLNNLILSRPFTNTNPAVAGPDAQIITLDGLAEGSFVGNSSNSVSSWAPWLRRNIFRDQNCFQIEPDFCETCDSCTASGYDSCTMIGECSCDPDVPCQSFPGGRRVDLIGGYRFFKFRDDFRSVETLMPTGDFFAPGTTYELTDVIQTNTEYHGFEFGLSAARQVDRFVVELDTLLAIGRVTHRYTLDGRTTATVPGITTQSIPGGFLVRPENIGAYRRDDFALLPQLRLRIKYYLGRNLFLDAGYNYLYLDKSIRAGSLFSTEFDSDTLATTSTTVGTQQPTPATSGLSIQGINVGLTLYF